MAENEQVTSRESPHTTELQDFKNVNNGLMRDALNVWADLWAELVGQVGPSTMVGTKAEDGFEPSCGWSDFLEKMWVLRSYLDFSKRLSQ